MNFVSALTVQVEKEASFLNPDVEKLYAPEEFPFSALTVCKSFVVISFPYYNSGEVCECLIFLFKSRNNVIICFT